MNNGVRREFSAGGVLVRPEDDRWEFAAIRPGGRPAGLWALPKGQIQEGETGETAALREVAEETGAVGHSLGKLGDIRYWFNWKGERIFKIVSFFLIEYETGDIGVIDEEFRHEVADVQWLPLDDAAALLAYKGEREMAELAVARLAARDS
jgi:8-oxo-dGTP pyrophosphatase MutT (NUDIX family)